MRKNKKLQPKEVKFMELHGELVSVNVFPTTRKNRRTSKMSTSSRTFKSPPPSFAWEAGQGFHKR